MAPSDFYPDRYIDDDIGTSDEQPIHLLAEDCKEIFDECLARSVTSHQHPLSAHVLRTIKQYQHRFDGWCIFLGVFADETSALDYRLRQHVALQDMIMRLLDVLRQNLFLSKETSTYVNATNSTSHNPRAAKCR